ncbi:MAG: hypothetical protein KGI27_13770, partial [Thaumarchaeota archaeon]|nr:hypothetical protein [Nitrososphaerota archaeon]
HKNMNNENKIKRNITKRTATTIISTIMIGLVLLSPTVIIPHVSAQQQGNIITYNDIPNAIKGKIATLTEQANQQVEEKINNHPGWIGIISGSGGKVSIDYVGPAATNPYHHNAWNKISSLNASSATPKSNIQPAVTCGIVESQSISPKSFESGSYTTAYHIEHNLLAAKSGTSTVDYLVSLNAWSGDSSTWMQAGIMYDNADCTGTGAGWYGNFDSHAAGNTVSNIGFPLAHPMTVTTGDNIDEDTYAAGSGKYQMYVTEVANGNYTEVVDNVGDSVNTLVLKQYASGNYEQDSGTQAEEPTSNSSTWGWGTPFFYYAFWHTTSDPGTTDCNNWFSPVPANGVNNPVTTSTNTSPCYDEMSYP